MSEQGNFQDIRTHFFENPDAPINPEFVNALSTVAQSLLGSADLALTLETDATASPLMQFAADLITLMQYSRHFGKSSVAQIHPSGNLPAALAYFSSTLRNNNTIVGEVSPVETRMEQEAIGWLIREIARYSEKEASGAIISGGTLANITALLVAREKLVQQGWSFQQPAHILTNAMAHYSIRKAAFALAPGGLIQVTDIPLREGSFVTDTKALAHYVTAYKKLGVPIMAIVGLAGETETGLVDDLQAISDIALEHNIHYHVDGAYGAPFRLSKKGALFDGMENSHSLTIDPHKYLYTPYSAGSILFANSQDHALIEALNNDGGAYMFKEGEERAAHSFKDADRTYLGKRRLEGSMGGQGAAAVWAVIHTLGTEGLRVLLDHTIDVTDAVYRHIYASKVFSPAYLPQLNTLCFYPVDKRISQLLRDPREQARLVETASALLEKETGAYLSTTTLPLAIGEKGSRVETKVFRFVATHPYTEADTAINILDNLLSIWDRLVHQEKTISVNR